MSLIEKWLFITTIKRIKPINSNNPVLTGLYFNLGGCDMLLDTIVAISTPLGEGAIGIIRLSGPDAFMIADEIFRPFNRKEAVNRQMIYGHIYKESLNLSLMVRSSLFLSSFLILYSAIFLSDYDLTFTRW